MTINGLLAMMTETMAVISRTARPLPRSLLLPVVVFATILWPSPSPTTSSPGMEYLYGVAALSADYAWSVGEDDGGGVAKTLARFWDGESWQTVSTPNPTGNSGSSLEAVTVVSRSDAWAVGTGEGTKCCNRALIEHWDGSAWKIVPAPKLPNSQTSELDAVSFTPTAGLWAVGDYETNGVQDKIHLLLLHRVSGHWTFVQRFGGIALARLFGLSSDGAGGLWAVGEQRHHNSTSTLLLHLSDGVWSLVDSPNLPRRVAPYGDLLRSVTASAPDDAWAVGCGFADAGQDRAVVSHWDGTSWSLSHGARAAQAKDSCLYGVQTAGQHNAVAVGGTFANQRTIEAFRQGAWNLVTLGGRTDGRLTAVSIPGRGSGVAVGWASRDPSVVPISDVRSHGQWP